ncbi:hypothetical protein AMIS_58290 [Actinoplanes missouriensis 431]|uniref:VanZ-like domain-containing protein n=1 Tax=Actinoplanes missouriensis (strain ATCC 14538 / DSM 43046 / CBS 188.64 / JCM 3121 / NBRC 102363 / NCIMB 12654 / NRRL B-3342 / UNCC 431) TaxID=512565 RepID=I0HDG2_ACTM4|nr:VanZ family protein [Actinoplanes missouriensis]BAL91049.1 hypothetical protein AMIS_58290 [Actinoplanes missouriensis 431]
MQNHHLDIPALPVLLPLGVVLMVVTGLALGARRMLTIRRLLAGWAAGWYAVAILGATMLPMRLSWGGGELEANRLILEPVVSMRPTDFLLNIVMTVPLAAVLHVVFGVRDQRRVVLTGFLLSLAIELTQAALVLTLHGNRWADVNDLISNTSGAYLGFLLFHRLMRSARFRRAVERCSFARPAHAAPIAV